MKRDAWLAGVLLLERLATLLLWAVPAWTEDGGTGNDRIFWVIPNYRTEELSLETRPLPAAAKLKIAVQDSFDPYAFPVAGFYAGAAHAQDQYSSWGQGASSFGKRYAGAFADQTVGNFMTEAVFPSMLHQDPRYFRLGRGGFWRRAGYAASRVFVTRTDAGGAQFNYSEFAGNAVMAGASNAYYPPADRTLSATAGKWGIQIGLDMVFNVMKEFWPDIRQKLF